MLLVLQGHGGRLSAVKQNIDRLFAVRATGPGAACLAECEEKEAKIK
jgi:hypothetical protein